MIEYNLVLAKTVQDFEKLNKDSILSYAYYLEKKDRHNIKFNEDQFPIFHMFSAEYIGYIETNHPASIKRMEYLGKKRKAIFDIKQRCFWLNI